MASGSRSTSKKDAENVNQSKENKTAEKNASGALPFKFVALPSPPDDTYTDGVCGIVAGRDVVKLKFYRSIGFDSEEKKEIRIISHRLVLPRLSMPELMKMLQGYAQAIQQAEQKLAEQSTAETKT